MTLKPEQLQALSFLLWWGGFMVLSRTQKGNDVIYNHRVKRAFRIQQIAALWPSANVMRSQLCTPPSWQEIVLAVAFFLCVSLWVAFVVQQEAIVEQQIRELQK